MATVLTVAAAALAALPAALAGAFNLTTLGPHPQKPAGSVLAVRCSISPTREVAPLALMRGDTARVTTTLQVACIDDRPLHLVLLVDASEGMAGAQLDGIRSALLDAVRALDLSTAQACIVSIGGRPETNGAEIVSYLTHDIDRLTARLRGLTATGPACLTCGLDDAFIVMRVGREGRPPEDLREVILLASAGVEPSACEAVRGKAREIQAHSVLVVTACSGPDCALRCLSEAATPRFAFRTDSWGGLAGLLRAMQDRTGAFHALQRARFEDDIGPVFAIVGTPPGTASAHRFDLEIEPWPDGGVQIVYEVRAIGCGLAPMSQRAQVTLSYDDGRYDTLALANPRVAVSCPGVTVTPATATPQTVPSISPTPAPPVATGTPERPFESIWLPWLGAPGCSAAYPGIDLVLLVDVSGSMAAPLPPYASRWDAVRTFAADVAASLGAADRIAVVAYAETPQVVVGLTSDHTAARQTILEGLPKADGSRLDEGLRAAARLLAEAGKNPSRREVVLLTDGDLNQATEGGVAIAAADLAKTGAGLRVLLVGETPAREYWRVLAGPGRAHALDPAQWRSLVAAVHCH